MSSIERRAYLRYNISIHVDLIDQHGTIFKATTRDISLGGMRVACESAMLTQLLPAGIKTAPGDQVILKTVFKNPKTEEELELQSHVLGVMRLAESDFCIRFSFGSSPSHWVSLTGRENSSLIAALIALSSFFKIWLI